MADTITVFKGDGIGPEITDSVLRILDAAGADLNYEVFNYVRVTGEVAVPPVIAKVPATLIAKTSLELAFTV